MKLADRDMLLNVGKSLCQCLLLHSSGENAEAAARARIPGRSAMREPDVKLKCLEQVVRPGLIVIRYRRTVQSIADGGSLRIQ
jgi:hypothetical protein